MKKIYGANGFMDWVALIPVGKARVKVHFTGGALTAYGVTPAEYATTDPFTQHVIENSAYYKDGRITLVKAFGEERSGQPEPSEEAPAAPAGLERVEVSCLQDAIDYLVENFGATSHKVRTKAAASAFAESHGITFVGL